ncbi:unnamed protein product [Lathyrus oleraceus]|uniref:Uncharacterized protein n=1 Tax=Pisum sativum TaxID=3888 RepID=A0A9D4WJI9_PEA|nr:uncharacterized protein LOC127085479 [Pisum sativum]KAI5402677.1 hypothetical protein KIW84_050323 [Pisum sativum]
MYQSSSTMKSRLRPPRPIPKSPTRVATRTIPDSVSLQTPPGSLMKSQKPVRSPEQLRPEYRTIACEFRALSKMVNNQFGKPDPEEAAFTDSCNAKSGVLFQRGRLYDEYSARRNERLKRKQEITVNEVNTTSIKPPKVPPSHRALGVNVESGKKINTARKLGSLRKSVSAAYSAEVSETPRYMLRSRSKDNSKKPPLASRMDKSAAVGEKKIGATPRRTGRISYY